jgi:hypothetical protein
MPSDPISENEKRADADPPMDHFAVLLSHLSIVAFDQIGQRPSILDGAGNSPVARSLSSVLRLMQSSFVI